MKTKNIHNESEMLFYPSPMEAYGWLAGAFLYGGMLLSVLPKNLYTRLIFLSVFCVFLLIGLKKLFFPAPLCTLTPQGIRFDVNGKYITYDKIASFHPRMEPGYASSIGGAGHFINNLGFWIAGEGLYIFPAHRLSEENQRILIQKLKEKRLKFTKEKFDPTSSFPFARFFKSRKK